MCQTLFWSEISKTITTKSNLAEKKKSWLKPKLAKPQLKAKAVNKTNITKKKYVENFQRTMFRKKPES